MIKDRGNSMKIAFMCDMHLPNNPSSSQYAYFSAMIEKLKADRVKTVISVGDITSFGEKEIFIKYMEDMKDFDHHYVIGNSDVRDEKTKDYFIENSGGFSIRRDGRTILGVDTPYGVIADTDKEKILQLKDGDVLVIHYYVEALKMGGYPFLKEVCKEKALTVIVGHEHKRRDYIFGRSRVIGLRALDPDKSIGGYPCIDCFDFGGNDVTYEEITIKTPLNVLADIRAHFGISCVDNLRDLTYALENNVYAVELRTDSSGWTPDPSLIPLIEKWREKTGGYLSVHFPDLGYSNGEIVGKKRWDVVTEYAIAIKANGITMHPPRRVKRCDMPKSGEIWQKFADVYIDTIRKLPATVQIGIENLHMEAGEADNMQRSFGYTPAEVSDWIDTLNTALSSQSRVGHTLDVGHARNNGHLSQIYPISRWYEIMGSKAVAYHIHQVMLDEREMYNHNAIENWFGPLINYASFFYSWENNVINHKPIFLEVRGSVPYQKSVEAFDTLLRDGDILS